MHLPIILVSGTTMWHVVAKITVTIMRITKQPIRMLNPGKEAGRSIHQLTAAMSVQRPFGTGLDGCQLIKRVLPDGTRHLLSGQGGTITGTDKILMVVGLTSAANLQYKTRMTAVIKLQILNIVIVEIILTFAPIMSLTAGYKFGELPREENPKLNITVQLFSGRPNPSWIIVDEEAFKFVEALRHLQPIFDTNNRQIRLGYQGLEVTIIEGKKIEEYFIFNGRIFHEGKQFIDQKRVIELTLLQTGASRLDPQLLELIFSEISRFSASQ